MARIFTCGFEENDLTATMWTAIVGTTPPISIAVVHSGTYALAPITTGASGVYRQSSAAVTTDPSTFYTRAYVRKTGNPSVARYIQKIGNNSSFNVIRLELTTGGVLRINNNTTATFVSGPTLSNDTWYRIELRYLMSNTAGQVEVRVFEVSGTTETEVVGSPFGIGNFTGGNGTDEDTQHLNGVQRFLFGDENGGLSSAWYLDDIAINDTSGSFQASWPGAGKIALAEPGGETAMGWEDETAGASVYTNVNDLPGTPDDANYNKEDDTDAQIDQMTLATLPAEILSDADMILLDLYARVGSTQTNATTGRLKIWDEASVLTNGPNVAFAINGWRLLSVGPTNEHQVFDLGTRTKANVQDFDIGYENITNVATRARRVSALWANVEWIEAAAGGGPVAYAPNRNIQINYGGTFAGAGRGVFGRRCRKGRWSLPPVTRAA